MKHEHGNISDSTGSPEIIDAITEPRRLHLGRRALLRSGALGLAGAVSARFPAVALAQSTGKPFQSLNMPFLTGMIYGRGVDVLTGAQLGIAVDPGPVARQSGGLNVSFRITRVDSQEELLHAIGVDVETSAHFSLFSSEGIFGFINQLTMSRQSTHLLVRVVATYPAETLTHPRYTDEALALLKTVTPDQFRARFGDGFVSSMQTGGEYFALFSILSESLDIQQCACASLKADFENSLTVFFAPGGFSQQTRDLLSNCVVRILTYQQGGGADGSSPASDPEKILQRISEFPKLVEQNPVVHTVWLTGYATLAQWDPPAIGARLQALKDYIRARLFLREKRDDVAEQLAHSEVFVEGPPVSVLNRWLQYLNDEINAFNKVPVDCALTGACPLVPLRLPDDYQDPVRPLVAVLFEKESYGGKVTYLKHKGFYDFDSPEMAWALDGGHLNSIKVPQALVIRLYEEPYFQGDHLDITESHPTIGIWSSRTRSMAVYGAADPEPRIEQVVIFTGNNYTMVGSATHGRVCRLSESANVAPAGHQGWFDNVGPIRSIRVPKGMKATVWENTGFNGVNYDLFSDMPHPEPESGRPVGASLRVFRLP
jgi:hypothetical protein